MKKNYLVYTSRILFLSGLFLFFLNPLLAQVVQTFTYTGSTQTFVVPSCVGSMTVEVRAAGGSVGGSSGGTAGSGSMARGVMTATPGTTMYINVGGQGSITAGGFNGGGDGGVSSSTSGGGGGGASDVRLGSNALASRIIVAGGGGGGGGATTYGANGANGGGGTACTNPLGVGGGVASGFGTGGTSGGCSGGTAPNYASGGAGAGLTSGGGGGGQPSSTTGGYGCAGTLGAGGAGGGTSFICGGATGGTNGGGGGGGGYYGGGGGMTGTGGGNGGGGGGSSYASALFSGATFSTAASTGHGTVILTYIFNGTGVTATTSPASICNGSSATILGSGVLTYTWLPVGSFLGSNASSITISPSVTTSYSVSGTNNLGCISQSVITVTVSSGTPVLSVTSSTNSLCLGRTMTITANGALTYTWTNGITNGVSFTPTSGNNTYTVVGQNGCGTSTAVTSVSVSALPVSVVGSSTLICATRPATLTASSGVTGYTWQPGSVSGASIIVSPSISTLYTVTASDGTCSGTATLNLSTNPLPTISIVAGTSVVCQGAPVTLTASGALSFTWSPGNSTASVITVNPTGPTLYSVTGVNSFNCTDGNSQVILTNPSPTISILASDYLICNGNSSTLTANGANTYTWNTNSNINPLIVTPAATTVFTITGTTNGCDATQTVQVAVLNASVAISGPTAICNGASATLIASGADSYQWVNGLPVPLINVSPGSTTIYTVSALTSSGNINCPSSNTFQLLVNPNPTVTIVPTRTFMCIKENNTLVANGASTYSWSTGVTSNSIVVSSTLATTLGYTVTGTDANGCENIKVYQLKINGCTALLENTLSKEISVYPNPSNGPVYIESETDRVLQISNDLGQVIMVLNLNACNGRKQTLQDLQSGIYFISSDTLFLKLLIQ